MNEPIYCVCGLRFSEIWQRESHCANASDFNPHGTPTPYRVLEILLREEINDLRDEVANANDALEGDSNDAEHDALRDLTDTVEGTIERLVMFLDGAWQRQQDGSVT